MRKLLLASLVFLGVMAFAGGQAHAVVIINPGFETGDFTGWTISGNTGFTSVTTVPHTGVFGADLGPVGSLGYMTQFIPTVSGQCYDLTFWLENSFSPNEFQALWNGAIVFDMIDIPDQGYTQYTVSSLVATGASTDLTFGYRNDPSFIHLDDIAVETCTPVPEPASIGLLGFGLLAAGVAAAKRRRSA